MGIDQSQVKMFYEDNPITTENLVKTLQELGFPDTDCKSLSYFAVSYKTIVFC